VRYNHSLAATAFAAVAGTFSEPIRIEPLLPNEYGEATPDGQRAVVTTRAVVALTPAVDGIEGRRRGSDMQGTTTLALRKAMIWFPPAVYAGLGYGLRPGDRIVLTDRPGQPRYLVEREPVSSDRGDIAVYLVVEADE